MHPSGIRCILQASDVRFKHLMYASGIRSILKASDVWLSCEFNVHKNKCAAVSNLVNIYSIYKVLVTVPEVASSAALSVFHADLNTPNPCQKFCPPPSMYEQCKAVKNMRTHRWDITCEHYEAL
ncbi:hypothetical protein Tcan_08217 [Toxocara canis]|uniref:Uncharacterized protein n=1 Tax=Toxocara canis TaxID=6265 RepID=A0A0B2VVJ1_TOXCA|nr:hypothetical protein Tcan_08217 [Toxocara canis]